MAGISGVKYSQPTQQARLAVALFHKWEKTYKVKPILLEKYLVSQRYGYGGTPDLFAEITTEFGQTRELVDFKTSKEIYPTTFVQVAHFPPWSCPYLYFTTGLAPVLDLLTTNLL